MCFGRRLSYGSELRLHCSPLSIIVFQDYDKPWYRLDRIASEELYRPSHRLKHLISGDRIGFTIWGLLDFGWHKERTEKITKISDAQKA